jgi:hypothetical protein
MPSIALAIKESSLGLAIFWSESDIARRARMTQLGPRLVIVFLLWMAISNASFSASTQPPTKSKPAAQTASQTLEPPRADSASVASATEQSGPSAGDYERQIEILKSQVEISRGFQSDVLVTLWGAFAVLVVVAGLLVGYNWYTNNQMYQRDKASLLQELTSQTQTRNKEVEQSLRSDAQTERARIDAVLETIRTDIFRRIEESAAAQREATDTAISVLGKKLEKSIESEINKVTRMTKYVGLRLTHTQMLNAKTANHWGAVATGALHLIEQAEDVKSDFFAKAGLEALEAAIDNDGSFTPAEVEKAPAILKKVPKELTELAEKIMEKIRNVKPA